MHYKVTITRFKSFIGMRFGLVSEETYNLLVTGPEAENLRALLESHADSVDSFRELAARYESE